MLEDENEDQDPKHVLMFQVLKSFLIQLKENVFYKDKMWKKWFYDLC